MPTKQQQALDAYWSAKTPNEERAAWRAMKGLGMMMEDAVAPGLAGTEMTLERRKMQRHQFIENKDLYPEDSLMRLLIENAGHTEKSGLGEIVGPPGEYIPEKRWSQQRHTLQYEEMCKANLRTNLFENYSPAEKVNEMFFGIDPASGPDKSGTMAFERLADGTVRVVPETRDSRYTRAHAILREQLPEVDPVRLSMTLDLVFDAVAGGSLATTMEARDALMLARSERDAARMTVTSLENRVAELESYSAGTALLHDEITRLRAVVASQAKSQTASDLKAPAPPKPFPAGALKQPTSDPRRIGG